MNRTLLLLIIVLILGAGTAWLFFQKGEDPSSTLVGWDRDFKVENTDEIHKIFLADRNGGTVTLDRKDGYWMYNNKYRARPNAVENLLDAISRIEMKYKPPRAAIEPMIKSLATEGIKVEVYGKTDNLLKSYYVGGSTPDERGTYMIMDKAEEPYVVSIPSWEGNVRFRYNLQGANWRDKTVFAFEIEDIQSVSIEYPKQKNRSFFLEKRNEDYEVRPFYDITPTISRPYKKGSAQQFLYGFEKLIAEGIENKNEVRDSITQMIPFSIITLTDSKGAETEVKLHPIHPKGFVDPKTGIAQEGQPAVDRYYADMVSSGDFMLVQDRLFNKILWGYDFFFE